MDYTISIIIHDNNVILFDIYKKDTVICFDLNNQNGSIMWNQALHASDDEIREVVSYINSFLDDKIIYGSTYTIDDAIIEQLNAIPNCEASRIDEFFEYEEYDGRSSSSEEEFSGWCGNRTYTSMCEDD